jgi:MFS-type transporter involved in bile tolerance (Atg22 family)
MYSLAGKSSAIMGPLLFGTISSVFGSQRPAILAVSVFYRRTAYYQASAWRRTEHKTA